MKDIRINPDINHANLIIQGLIKKDGFCPCKVGKLEENKCPCDQLINEGECHCKLYVKEV